MEGISGCTERNICDPQPDVALVCDWTCHYSIGKMNNNDFSSPTLSIDGNPPETENCESSALKRYYIER
jgi:hypothetical protein